MITLPAPASLAEETRSRLHQVLDTPQASSDVARFRLALAKPEANGGARRLALLQSHWRFEAQFSDLVRPLPGACLIADADGVYLAVGDERFRVEARDREALGRLLSAGDGCAVADVVEGSDPEGVLSIVQASLGRAFELEVVATLGRQVSHLELSRFPTTKYAVARSYWENSVAVRAELRRFPEALGTRDTFVRFLRELHVLYLMGATLSSFYPPMSQTRTMLLRAPEGPGQLRRSEVNCPITQRFAMEYFRLLAQSLGDRFATSDQISQADSDGLSWGHTCWGSRVVAGLSEPIHLFCPPPEVTDAHIDRLWASACAACDALHTAERAAVLNATAEFFRRFICLHPFPCGNLGLVMNIVNWMLQRAIGGCVCHLHLDWCAHRLEAPHFATLFTRVVDRYLVRPEDSDAESRVLALFGEMRREVMALPDRAPTAHDALLLR